MFVLGLILVLLAAAVTTGVVYDGRKASTVEIFGTSVDTTVAGVFFTGAATSLLFLVGVWLLSSSFGRSRRKRQERKVARRQQGDSVARLESERTELRAENERLHQRLDGAPPEDASSPPATTRATDSGETGSGTTGSTVARPPEDSRQN